MIEINNKKGMSNIYQNGDCTLQKGAKDFRNNPENDRENKKNGVPDTRSEHGRSMVEMLGVLAIIGLLGVTGVLGYQNAMNIYRANETIREINQRAVIYSQQLLSGSEELSSQEFEPANVTMLGYPLESSLIENQPFFKIELTSVPKAVCKNIVNADWYVPAALYVNGHADYGDGVNCPIKENTMAFYFYHDLAEHNIFESSETGFIPEETPMYICRSNSDCIWSSDGPVCDTDTGKCGPCSSNEDCTAYAYTPVCNVETGRCEKCTSDADCAVFPGKPYCETTRGRCVECLTNEGCTNNENGEICNTSTYVCRPCTQNADCEGQPNGEVCDLTRGVCVECLDNPDCVDNPAGKVCMTETQTCELCEARTCTDDSGCNENEACMEGKCICPNGFWINNCQCVACPEGSTPRLENDAVDCICPELSVWKNGECVSCLDDIRKISGTVYHLADELDQCNNSCPEGYYALYWNSNGTSNLKVKCASIGNEFSIDSKSDEWLVNKYNRLLTYSAYEGALGADEKEAFGLNLTAVQIRKRLHELLDEYYLPTFQTNWWAAQSWCRAKGGHLVSREKYFENGLRFAAAIASGGQYLRLWADGANIGSTWTSGRSTVWQSGGWDSSENYVYFICEK